MKQALKTNSIGIIGLGLIGTSLGMAIRSRNSDLNVVGLTRSAKNGTVAKNKRAVDKLVHTLPELITKTDLIILATPIGATIQLLKTIGAVAQKPILVTDTGSTKEEICRAADDLPTHVTFVGGHPMAGKENSGPLRADANLFVERPWILTPNTSVHPHQLKKLEMLITSIGAHPLHIDAADHDRLITPISHLPFMIAILLMETATGHPEWSHAKQLAGSGFRDTTRLASGNPQMHGDILYTNRANIMQELLRFESALQSLKNDLTSHRWLSITKRLTRVQKLRQTWERSRI